MNAIFNAVDVSGIRADAISGATFIILLMAIAFVTRLIIALIFPQSGMGSTNDD